MSTMQVGVGIVILRDEEVLLIRRGKPPREGGWSLPGGAPPCSGVVHRQSGNSPERPSRCEVGDCVGNERCPQRGQTQGHDAIHDRRQQPDSFAGRQPIRCGKGPSAQTC